MTKYSLILLILLGCACKPGKKKTGAVTSGQKTGTDSCTLQQQQARTDLAKGKLKYYVYGIAAPTAKFIKNYRQHNIEVVVWGCILPAELNCYNRLADSIMHK